MNRTQKTWIADVFTVPTGAKWAFDTVVLTGYQYGSGLTSTFTSCNLMIYSSTPTSLTGAIWGDTVTNVLVATGFTGMYRVDTMSSTGGLLSTNRPMMYLKLFLPHAPHLSSGTYWLAWSATGSASLGSPSCPPKVLPGRINPSGQMGMQYSGGTWAPIIDSGNRLGFNKVLKGSAALVGMSTQINESQIVLGQNIPNPVSSSTTIDYFLPDGCNATISLYNILGQHVVTLINGFKEKGKHQVTYSLDDLPNGLYYYQLKTEVGAKIKSMVLQR